MRVTAGGAVWCSPLSPSQGWQDLSLHSLHAAVVEERASLWHRSRASTWGTPDSHVWVRVVALIAASCARVLLSLGIQVHLLAGDSMLSAFPCCTVG